jgi:glycerate-2-kinase
VSWTGRDDARACFAAALDAAQPGPRVSHHLRRSGGSLVLATGTAAPLSRHDGPVLLVGAGKAALGMATAAVTAIGTACVGGLVIVPRGGIGPCGGGVEIAEGGHPLPDASGEQATGRLLDNVAAADAETLVLVVLSGGASALLVAPADGVTLADKRAVTAALLGAGADIAALNTVRKHCSRVKGGGLARAAARTRGIWTLVLSDVVGDDLATIASGPTAADPTTFADAAGALDRYLHVGDVPAPIADHIRRGRAARVPETVKPGDPVLSCVRMQLVGGNADAVAAAAATAATRGYAVDVVAPPLGGDAAEAGQVIAERLRAARRREPVAVVAGGETTVRVRPGGRGGRCQHLALAAAIALAGESAVVLAAGTDGVDGPTDAGGACVDGDTVARARGAGFDPVAALAATDSHSVLAATGDLVVTGPTGTNVADVVVALRPAC